MEYKDILELLEDLKLEDLKKADNLALYKVAIEIVSDGLEEMEANLSTALDDNIANAIISLTDPELFNFNVLVAGMFFINSFDYDLERSIVKHFYLERLVDNYLHDLRKDLLVAYFE